MLVSWVAFPLLLLLVWIGCGLLVREVSRVAVPAPLLPALGLAFVIVLGELTTIGGSTTELSTPLAIAAATAGFLLARPSPAALREHGWALAAGVAVFVVYAAPIVLSGEPTFAGYVELDDTATWLALTDRLMEHGRDIGGLAPSTYEATLSFNLTSGYPIGVFLPLGMGVAVIGRDGAWLFQPYMAVLGALLALCLYSIAGQLISSRPLRALVAALAAQPALLFGYYLWGGVKEIASVTLLAMLVPLLPPALEGWRSWRLVLPAALGATALVGVLSAGGASVWLAPALGLAAVLGIRQQGVARIARSALAFVAAFAVLCVPWLISGGIAPRDAGALTDPRELGNLIAPLDLWQVFGIWPAGDFRVGPKDPEVTAILIVVVAIAAIAAGVYIWRERLQVPALFIAALALGCVALVVIGSPWIDAKALATASAAVLFTGLAGGAALIDRGYRVEGGAALAVIAIGVLWSNALAIHEEWLAPHDRLAELEHVGNLVAGDGPTLMTEYEPYGARHFLRNADPEGASELRRRQVFLRGGGTLGKAESADIDRFDLPSLLVYPTLVLRRSPTASRPPLPFRLRWQGRYYEVWQQPRFGATVPVAHLPLGRDDDPVSRPDCERVKQLATLPGVTTLAVSARPAPTVIDLGSLRRPADWPTDTSDPAIVYPDGSGTARGDFILSRGGRFGTWIGGSFRGQVELSIDGRAVGSARHVIDHGDGMVELGAAAFRAGRHRLELSYEEGGLDPGSGGTPFGVGPVVVSPATAADARISYHDAGSARALCSRDLDWIAALESRG